MNGSFSSFWPCNCLYCAYRIEITDLNLGKFTVSNPSGRGTAGYEILKLIPLKLTQQSVVTEFKVLFGNSEFNRKRL